MPGRFDLSKRTARRPTEDIFLMGFVVVSVTHTQVEFEWSVALLHRYERLIEEAYRILYTVNEILNLT